MKFAIRPNEASLLAVGTFVVWTSSLAVGALGLALPYPHVPPPAKEPAPVQAQVMRVALAQDESPPPDIGPPQPAAATPTPPAPAPAIAPPPDAPPQFALATPSPTIAFAVPTKAAPAPANLPSTTASTAPAAQASSTAAPTTRSNAGVTGAIGSADAPQRLVFGQGEARQPAPEYPREAALDHEQGTVTVRFVVDEAGHVRSAEASTPSHFPLLNNAAVRAIREKWRFDPGPVRTYEVPIRFQLKQK